jgi:hypothetical protein
MTETARLFFIVSPPMKWMVHFNKRAGGMFRTFATVPSCTMASLQQQSSKPVRLEQPDKKMPPGNRTAS